MTDTTGAPAWPALPVPGAGRAIRALVLREISTMSGRSPLGWAWLVAEPVAVVALLTFLFSRAFDTPPLGLSFALFYATGYIPFALFADVSGRTAQALRQSRQLLAYPALTHLDAILARAAVALTAQLAAAGLVLAGLCALLDTGAIWDAGRLAAALGLAALLALAAGVLNAALFSLLPVWERLWQIAMRPLFLLSGIFFVMEDLPITLRPLAALNPLLHVTGLMRSAAIPTYAAPLAQPLAVLLFGLGVLILGLLFLRLLPKGPAHV